MKMDEYFGNRMIAIRRDHFGFREGLSIIGLKYEPNARSRKVFELVPTWNEITEGSPLGYSNDIVLRPEQAQELMDSLWQCGMRPAQGSGSAGSLAATEAHLATVKEYLDRVMTLIEKPLIFARSVGKDEK